MRRLASVTTGSMRVLAFEINALPFLRIGVECADFQPLGLQISKTVEATCVRKCLQSTFDHTFIMRGFCHIDERAKVTVH